MLKIREGFIGERSVVVPEIVLRLVKQDSFLSNLYISAIGYYPHALHHYRERNEFIDQYLLIYCIDGSGFFTIDNKTYTVHRHQFFILPPGHAHLYGSHPNNPWTIYWIHFAGKQAEFLGHDCIIPQEICLEKDSRIAHRNELFEEIFTSLSDGYELENLYYSSSLLYSYLASFRYLRQYRKGKKEQNISTSPGLLSTIIHYLQENIEQQLSLKQIAQFTGYSVSHLSALFKKETGQSPLVYFNQLKMQTACDLLTSTNMKVNQICSKVGINDCYYFSRLFKQTIGVSPRRFREIANAPVGEPHPLINPEPKL